MRESLSARSMRRPFEPRNIDLRRSFKKKTYCLRKTMLPLDATSTKRSLIHKISFFCQRNLKTPPFSAIRKSPFFHPAEPLWEELYTSRHDHACAAAARAGREWRARAVAPYYGEEEVLLLFDSHLLGLFLDPAA